MFPLLETAIGFLAVMLILSLLVKSLTSLIKDHFDFYTDNLKYEVNKFVRNTFGRTWSQMAQDPVIAAKAPWLVDIHWDRVGDEFFNKDNVEWLLKELGATGSQLENLDGRLAVHVGRVQYMFSQRMKNLSIAVGLALCLFLDINALTIWQTLYTHDQLRTTFSSQVATQALLDAQAQGTPGAVPPATAPNPVDGSAPAPGGPANQPSQSMTSAAKNFATSLESFTSTVSFGVGAIWKGTITSTRGMLLEFLSAFLTGILVSVGAPYWHDLLESVSSLRDSK